MEQEWSGSAVAVKTLEERVATLESLLLGLVEKQQPTREVGDLYTRERGFSNGDGGEEDRDINDVSIARVEEFVDALMAHDANNFGWIPDAIEKRINRRIIYLALGAIKQTLESAHVDVAGMRLSFSLVPRQKIEKDADGATILEEGSALLHGKVDALVKAALQSLLKEAKVALIGHEIHFHLDDD